MGFGEYFRALLSEKNIRLAELANQAGIKSKNELYRLFDNKYSYEKSLQLTQKILSVVELSTHEKDALYALMEDCKINPSVRAANEILTEIYKKEKNCVDVRFNSVINFIKRYGKCKITIYLGVLTTKECMMLKNILPSCDAVTINQMINFNASDEMVAGKLFSLATFFSDENYQAFETSKQVFDETYIMVENGDKFTIAVYDNYKLIESGISKKMAMYVKDRCSEYCKKPIKEHKGRVTEYAELVNFGAELDEKNIYSFYGMQCFSDIPFEAMYRMLVEANFFGFPKESEYVQKLVNAAFERCKKKKNVSSQTRCVLHEKRVEEFLKTGRTPDFLSGFNALNDDEKMQMIERFYDTQSNFTGKFLKDTYEIPPIECAYIEDKGISISNAATGYDKTYAVAIINHPKAMKVIDNFSQWFWENCTISEEESIGKMKAMVSEYMA